MTLDDAPAIDLDIGGVCRLDDPCSMPSGLRSLYTSVVGADEHQRLDLRPPVGPERQISAKYWGSIAIANLVDSPPQEEDTVPYIPYLPTLPYLDGLGIRLRRGPGDTLFRPHADHRPTDLSRSPFTHRITNSSIAISPSPDDHVDLDPCRWMALSLDSDV
nr:hypothetical protein CFP56_01044 [Quercus suber]